MGLTYDPSSLIERRMEYERIREEQREWEAAWEREELSGLRGEPRTDETQDAGKPRSRRTDPSLHTP